MGSARGPPSSRLLLQPHQAVGDALLVARQPHPDPLDVPGKTRKQESGLEPPAWNGAGRGWSQRRPQTTNGGSPGAASAGWEDTAHPEGWKGTAHPEGWTDQCGSSQGTKGHGSSQGMDGHSPSQGTDGRTELIPASPAKEHLILSHSLGHQGHGSGFRSQHIPVPQELEGRVWGHILRTAGEWCGDSKGTGTGLTRWSSGGPSRWCCSPRP